LSFILNRHFGDGGHGACIGELPEQPLFAAILDVLAMTKIKRRRLALRVSAGLTEVKDRLSVSR
jgi:hypothetical protein